MRSDNLHAAVAVLAQQGSAQKPVSQGSGDAECRGGRPTVCKRTNNPRIRLNNPELAGACETLPPRIGSLVLYLGFHLATMQEHDLAP